MVAGAGGVAADSFAWAPRRIQVSRHDVAIPTLALPPAGLTVCHLSDLHLYDGLHAAARRTMELVAGLRPDLTIVTGDLVETPARLPEVTALLTACAGRLATVVTLGNWEHQVGVTPGMMDRTVSRAGGTFLYNETLMVETGRTPLAVVGLDDPRAGIPDPSRALREERGSPVALWAVHAPGYVDQLRAERWPAPHLVLSGHTHGGQIRPPLLPPITPPGSGRFVAGWYRDTFAPLYVSRGIGTSGIRARFRCAPEIGLFRLTTA